MNSPSFFRLARLAVFPAFLFFALVPAAPAVAKEDAAAEIAKLEPGYQAELEGIKTDHEKWDKALETWYSAALEKVLAERGKAGDLDGALATKAERERIAAHTDATAEEIQKMPPALRAVRGSYDATRKQIADQVAKRTGAANQKHLADLDALQRRLTQKNEIDEALQVKAEKVRLSAALAGGPALSPPRRPRPRPPTHPWRRPPGGTEARRPAAGHPANPTASEVMTVLVGRWRVTNASNGWSGTRTFKKDGTFTTEVDTGGKWELDGDKIVLHYEREMRTSSSSRSIPRTPK